MEFAYTKRLEALVASINKIDAAIVDFKDLAQSIDKLDENNKLAIANLLQDAKKKRVEFTLEERIGTDYRKDVVDKNMVDYESKRKSTVAGLYLGECNTDELALALSVKVAILEIIRTRLEVSLLTYIKQLLKIILHNPMIESYKEYYSNFVSIIDVLSTGNLFSKSRYNFEATKDIVEKAKRVTLNEKYSFFKESVAISKIIEITEFILGEIETSENFILSKLNLN